MSRRSYRSRNYNRRRPYRRRPRRRRYYKSSRRRHSQSRRRRPYRKRNYSYSRPPRRRTKSRSRRSNDISPADAAEFVTTLLGMPKEVLAGLAAGVLAALGSVALALLKVALWVVIVAGIALFGVLFIVGGFLVGRWTLQRMMGSAAEPAVEHTHERETGSC